MSPYFNYPSTRPWLLALGLFLVILLMGYAYHQALNRIQQESLRISGADRQVAAIYFAHPEHTVHAYSQTDER